MEACEYQERLGTFLIGFFEGVPPEELLDVTLAVTHAMQRHLAVLIKTVEESGRLDPESLAQLRRG